MYQRDRDIKKATVTFVDTGQSYELEAKSDSRCHFFDRFVAGDNEIQLRLDWKEVDDKGSPTLDADFYDKETGEKIKNMKGNMKAAHHTKPNSTDERSYCWEFDSFKFPFVLKVDWFMYAHIKVKRSPVEGHY